MLDKSYPMLSIPRSEFFWGGKLIIDYKSPDDFSFTLSYDCDTI